MHLPSLFSYLHITQSVHCQTLMMWTLSKHPLHLDTPKTIRTLNFKRRSHTGGRYNGRAPSQKQNMEALLEKNSGQGRSWLGNTHQFPGGTAANGLGRQYM